MTPDRPDVYQQAWKTQSAETNSSVDGSSLLRELQSEQESVRSSIFWNDVVAVGISVLLVPVWIIMGFTMASPWTWYLTVPVLLWNIGFTIVYRFRRRPSIEVVDEPLVACARRSLTQVEEQIWLKRSYFWWDTLPLAIAILASIAHISVLKADDWWDALNDVNTFVFIFIAAFFYWVYYLNQRVVDAKGGLESRRQELLSLLASLGQESTSEELLKLDSDRAIRPWKPAPWQVVTVATAACLFAGILVAARTFTFRYDGQAQSGGPSGDALAKLVTELRDEHDLVGLAAMVMVDGEVEAVAAHGERKKGSGVPVQVGDRWHLGGITKPITATMIARLVEAGQMNWSDTLDEVFSGAEMHPDWRSVTLQQLMTDTAGAPANFPSDIMRRRPGFGRECTDARREAVFEVIAKKPAYPAGETNLYSNVGYTIAGAMAEQSTGMIWEDLVKREVFRPLDLNGSGFGPPESSDRALEQPRGHREFLREKVAVDDDADNTPIMGPAGTIHMTLRDLCDFANEHLLGAQGQGTLLSDESYRLLHQPARKQYAFGWIERSPDEELPNELFWHNGSNTYWYALVVFIPEQQKVIAVTSNDGDIREAEDAAWKIVRAESQGLAGVVQQISREDAKSLSFRSSVIALSRLSVFARVLLISGRKPR